MMHGATPARRIAYRLALVAPAVLAPAAVAAAALFRTRFLLPILATLLIYPVMAALVAHGLRGAAAMATVLWAASLSMSIIALASRDPSGTGDLILRGPAYRDEMFAFIRSGLGKEGDPRLFLPEHLLHLGAFALLTIASAGLLGLALGAVLVGYMSYYVGALAAGPAPAIAFLLGWPPWAILRVVAFILLGIALSRPLLSRILRRPIPPVGDRAWYWCVGGLLAADVILKGLLAQVWAGLLRPCLGP